MEYHGIALLSFFRVLSQVVFHIEPYKERDDANMRENIKYIVER